MNRRLCSGSQEFILVKELKKHFDLDENDINSKDLTNPDSKKLSNLFIKLIKQFGIQIPVSIGNYNPNDPESSFHYRKFIMEKFIELYHLCIEKVSITKPEIDWVKLMFDVEKSHDELLYFLSCLCTLKKEFDKFKEKITSKELCKKLMEQERKEQKLCSLKKTLAQVNLEHQRMDQRKKEIQKNISEYNRKKVQYENLVEEILSLNSQAMELIAGTSTESLPN